MIRARMASFRRDRQIISREILTRVVAWGTVGAAIALYLLMASAWIADREQIGHDFAGYSEGFQRWLQTGTPYAPFELAGQFIPAHRDFIHPPSFLLLVGPFSVLPFPVNGILWVAIPLVLIVALLRDLPWWAFPIAFFLAFSNDGVYILLNGNSSIWFAAAFGWSLRFGWPAALIAMKPSLAPLLVAGFRRPLPTLLLAAAPIVVTLPLWPDYLRVLQNSSLPLGYSFAQWPVFVLAALPWICRVLGDRIPAVRAIAAR